MAMNIISRIVSGLRRTSPIMLIPVDLDCQAIVDHVQSMDRWTRSEYEGPLDKTESNIYDPVLDHMAFSAVSQAVQAYYQHFPALQVSRDERYKIMRYQVGQEFPLHVDQNAMELQYTRALSVVIYLNEDFEGGDTVFPSEAVTIRPKLSHALVFPSGYAFPHRSTPITRGVKYALVTWLHMGPPWLTDQP